MHNHSTLLPLQHPFFTPLPFQPPVRPQPPPSSSCTRAALPPWTLGPGDTPTWAALTFPLLCLFLYCWYKEIRWVCLACTYSSCSYFWCSCSLGCSFSNQSLKCLVWCRLLCHYIPGSHIQNPGSSIQEEVTQREVWKFSALEKTGSTKSGDFVFFSQHFPPCLGLCFFCHSWNFLDFSLRHFLLYAGDRVYNIPSWHVMA